jgi:polyferredoxin
MGQGEGQFSLARQRAGARLLKAIAWLFIVLGTVIMVFPSLLMQGGSDPTGARIVAAVLLVTGLVKFAISVVMRRLLA